MAKIENTEELIHDARDNPERGKINGKDIINDRTEKIEIRISRETYKRLLLHAAAEGEPPATTAARLLKIGLATPDERGKVNDFLKIKAEIFGISVGEAILKILGYRKRIVREAKIKRSGGKDEDY